MNVAVVPGESGAVQLGRYHGGGVICDQRSRAVRDVLDRVPDELVNGCAKGGVGQVSFGSATRVSPGFVTVVPEVVRDDCAVLQDLDVRVGGAEVDDAVPSFLCRIGALNDRAIVQMFDSCSIDVEPVDQRDDVVS